MSIEQMLSRFRPLMAPDGEGTGAPVEGIAPAETEAVDSSDSGVLELPDDDALAELGDLVPDPSEPEEELEEYDLDGVKVKVPKSALDKIKEAAYRHADYTRKRQEDAKAAEEGKTAKARYEASLKEDEQIREGGFHLKQIDNSLNQRYQYFRSPEYLQLQNDDPLEARKVYDKFVMDKDTRNELAAAIGRLQAERNSKAADEAKASTEAESKRREHLPREIAKIVPGWNADRAAKVKDFAASLGYEPAALESTTDALHFKTLHLAEIGQRYLNAMSRKGTGAVQPKPVIAPTRTVGQRGTPARPDPDKLNGDEYLANYLAKEKAKRTANQ